MAVGYLRLGASRERRVEAAKMAGARAMDGLQVVLDKWMAIASEAEQAVKLKDFARLAVCRNEGDRCFDSVRNYLEQLEGRPLDDDSRRSLQKAVDCWSATLKSLEGLQEEIRGRLTAVRKRRAAGKKISGAYGKNKAVSGVNVRLKAR